MDIQFTQIIAPKFYLIDYNFVELNEYELRMLQIEVVTGMKPAGIRIKDVKGNIITINERGGFDELPFGIDLSDKLAIDLHDLRNNISRDGSSRVIQHFIVDYNEPENDPDPYACMYGE